MSAYGLTEVYDQTKHSFDAGRMAERRVGAGAQKLRRLIAEAERAARFLDDMGDLGRYRARELRNEIAAARAET